MKTKYDFAAAGRRGAAARRSVGGGWTKGKRRHGQVSERDLGVVLSEVMSAIRVPERGRKSLRVVAAHCGVSARTVGRWLDGTDWPPAPMVRRLQGWLRSI